MSTGLDGAPFPMQTSLLYRILQYAFFCRFQLFFGAVLIAFPLWAYFSNNKLVGNLFVLNTFEIGVVCFLGLICARTLVTTTGLVFVHGAERFAVEPPFPGSLFHRLWFRITAIGLLVAALVVVLLLRAEWPEQATLARVPYTGAVLGILAAIGVPYLIRWLPEPKWRLPWLTERVRPLFERGYLDEEGRFLPDHRKARSLFVITAVVYLLVFFLSHPDRLWLSVPGLSYLLLLFLVILWGLTALAFFGDFYRLPLLLCVGLLLVAGHVASDTDHYYPLEPDGHPQATTMQAVLDGWRANVSIDTEPNLVVIASSGGGIRAAYWTSVVLENMHADAEGRESVFPNLRLVSTVSGGSVGVLYAMDRWRAAGGYTNASLTLAREAAGENSLGAISWGLAYPDFVRPFFGSRLFPATLDRAWAMESYWRRLIASTRYTLRGETTTVENGTLPLVVFNSTSVESGMRGLLAPVDMPDFEMAWDFFDRYPNGDLDRVTAARLSATFPYVTPVARPMPADDDESTGRAIEHMADGGYYDNSGMMTAMEWVDWILHPDRRFSGLERVAILRIDSNPPSKVSKGGLGWLYTYLGPILAEFAVRNTTQQGRNAWELRLLKSKALQAGVEVDEFVFQLQSERSPLSWKLTAEEKADIESDWAKSPNQDAWGSLKVFLSQS